MQAGTPAPQGAELLAGWNTPLGPPSTDLPKTPDKEIIFDKLVVF